MASLRTLEENRSLYRKIILDYLDNDQIYDYPTYIKAQDTMVSSTVNDALLFAQKYISEDVYKKLYKKICPLKDINEENEELVVKCLSMAEKIYEGDGATIIDIIDEITPNLNYYIHLLRNLRVYHKMLSVRMLSANITFVNEMDMYRTVGNVPVTKYPTISNEDNEKIKKILATRNLPLNSITYDQAYEYAKREGIIKISKNIR